MEELAITENGKVLCTCTSINVALDLQTLLKNAGRETEVHQVKWSVQLPKTCVPFRKKDSTGG
jgi:hypothetical protein